MPSDSLYRGSAMLKTGNFGSIPVQHVSTHVLSRGPKPWDEVFEITPSPTTKRDFNMIEITPTPNISAWPPWLIWWPRMIKSGFLTPWSSSLELVLQVSIYSKKKKKKKRVPILVQRVAPPYPLKMMIFVLTNSRHKASSPKFGWFHIPDMYSHDLRRDAIVRGLMS